MHSLSPISGRSYDLSDFLMYDELRVKDFVTKHKDKTIVGVLGLGFVGAASATMIAKNIDQFAVIGFDQGSEAGLWKAGDINSKICPIRSTDTKLLEYFNIGVHQNLIASINCENFKHCDIMIVDINLDVEKKKQAAQTNQGNFEVNLDPFKLAMESVFKFCREDCHIIVETTVPPGTCSKVILPIAEREFEKRGIISRPSIGHSYERVTPGPNYADSIENCYRVYSGIDESSADKTESFLSQVINVDDFPLTRLKNTNSSEMAKVLENSYRAANIAFIDEWTHFAENADVDLFEVIKAIRMRPTHANIMYPGLGVGGYCLTKDPLLASWAAQRLFDAAPLRISEQSVHVNDNMPLHTAEIVLDWLQKKSIKAANILLLGVSYLNDIADTRSSPSELLYDQLIIAGHTIHLHDPIVSYWPEKNMLVSDKINPIQYDAIILAVGHHQYLQDTFWEANFQDFTGVFIDCLTKKSNVNFAIGTEMIKIGVGK